VVEFVGEFREGLVSLGEGGEDLACYYVIVDPRFHKIITKSAHFNAIVHL
jgi:hypothetical protein